MSADLHLKLWAATQPMEIMEHYLFVINDQGRDAASKWLMSQYAAAQL
jgi:hypothetical protein